MSKKAFVAGLLNGAAMVLCAAPVLAQAPVASRPVEAAQVDEIVVTANKREERLKDVPVTVSVVSGDQVAKQNVNEVTDLTRSVPSLNSAGPFGALSIRGVGSISFARSAEGSVGVVVDGVALANTSTNPPQLFDVARVEVLEGPQGTLFGRNTSAGVVNITTVAPDPSGFSASAHADVGERHTYAGRGVVNIPLADNAALRVSGSLSQAPRLQHNLFDDSWYEVQGKSVRGRLLWEPSEPVSVNLIADYSQFDRKGGVPWSVYQSTPGSRLSQRLAACGVVVGPRNQDGCTDGGYHQTTKSYGVSGQVDADLGALTLTSISAYRESDTGSSASDVDSVPINRLNINESPVNIRNFSQEFRLTSPVGQRIEYVVGLYGFDSRLRGSNTQRGVLLGDAGVPAVVGQIQTTRSSTQSYAAFGNATINVLPSLRLLVGARYGHEDVSALTTGRLASGAVAPILSIATIQGKAKDDYISYRLGAQYDLDADVMVYATYTKGYKGPSVNDQTGVGAAPIIVRPEIPHASELGVKANLIDGRLTASLAAFHNRITDFQAQFFDTTAGAFIFGNAPKLVTKGVSFNLIGRPMAGLTLNAGALYNDAKYGAGYRVSCAQGQTAAQGCVTVSPTISYDDAQGNPLVGAPKWKLTAFSEYTHTLTGGWDGFVQADVAYTSKINFDAAYSPQNTSKAATIVGGRIGVRTADERLGVSLYARNLFDTYRPVVRFATPTARQQLDPLSFSQISGPESRRTVGVSLDAKF
uniref:TonB-dependent receptor n=1 Tax=Caulobacter sp. (strain K31) TaxID=366602 RepID=B0T910_CAUSK